MASASCHSLSRLIVLSGLLTGCAAPASRPTYSTLLEDQQEAADRARACNEHGLALIEQNRFSDAENAFRQALAFDPTYAAAHNNLGILLLDHRQRSYEAAVELTIAARLAPTALQPHVNLGRLYEAVGWDEAAFDAYEKALALEDGDPQTLGRLAVLSLRRGKGTAQIEWWLQTLAAQGDAEEWQQWAQVQLSQRSAQEAGP